MRSDFMKKYLLIPIVSFAALCALLVPFLSAQQDQITSLSTRMVKDPPAPPDDTVKIQKPLDETIRIEEINVKKNVLSTIDMPKNLPVNGTLMFATSPTLTRQPPYIGILKTFVDKNRIIKFNCKMYQLKGEILSDRNVSTLQISADGQKALIVMGDFGINYATFTMYIWNITTNQVQKLNIPQIVRYPIVKWSADMRYVAYIVGTDASGNPDPFLANSVGLYVYDILEGKEKKVSVNDSLPGQFEWSGRDLYYSATRKINRDRYQKPYDIYDHTVDIHVYSTLGNADHVVLENAYRPSISPDGKRIVFFSSPNENSPFPTAGGWQMIPRAASLSIADVDGEERKRLNDEYMNYPQVYWLDNERILSLKMTSISPDQTLNIRTWNTKTGKFKTVAILKGHDYVSAGFSDPYTSFMTLGVNEENVMILSLELTGKDDSNPYSVISRTKRRLVNINVRTGEVKQIAESATVGIMAWQYN